MSKQYIVYGNSIPILSMIINENINHSYIKKIVNSKENENFERFLTGENIYNRIKTDGYIYILSETIDSFTIFRNYKFIDDIKIGFYEKSENLIIDKLHTFDINNLLISFKEIEGSIYTKNYYVYDPYTKNYYIPTKETLEKDILKFMYNNKGNQNVCINRKYLNEYMIESKEKPENIFDLFEITKSS